MKMWQASKASLLADRQLQLRLRTHWRSLNANSFPESTTESKAKEYRNVATQNCNHHHCQDKRLQPEWIAQLTLRSLLFPDEFVLSTLGTWLDSHVAIATMVCIRRNNGWNTLAKHQPEKSAVQCYEDSPNQCLPCTNERLSHHVLVQPFQD